MQAQAKLIFFFNGLNAGLPFHPAMSTVVLSNNFEVVIPQDIREALHLETGEKLRVSASEGHVELVPIRPIQSMRGFLRGMNADIERDEDRL